MKQLIVWILTVGILLTLCAGCRKNPNEVGNAEHLTTSNNQETESGTITDELDVLDGATDRNSDNEAVIVATEGETSPEEAIQPTGEQTAKTEEDEDMTQSSESAAEETTVFTSSTEPETILPDDSEAGIELPEDEFD